MSHTRFDEVCDKITRLHKEVDYLGMLQNPSAEVLAEIEKYNAELLALYTELKSLKGKRDVRRPED